jgi:hypothetical protein
MVSINQFWLKLTKVTFLVSALLLISNVFACAQSSASWIGTWRVDKEQTVAIMDSVSKSSYDTLSAQIKDRATASITGREFTFSANGDFSVSWKFRNEQKVSSGKWEVDVSKQLLIITVGDNAVNYAFQFESNGVLILKGKQNSGFFNNLYLRKL